jgi:hypothetical protein
MVWQLRYWDSGCTSSPYTIVTGSGFNVPTEPTGSYVVEKYNPNKQTNKQTNNHQSTGSRSSLSQDHNITRSPTNKFEDTQPHTLSHTHQGCSASREVVRSRWPDDLTWGLTRAWRNYLLRSHVSLNVVCNFSLRGNKITNWQIWRHTTPHFVTHTPGLQCLTWGGEVTLTWWSHVRPHESLKKLSS